MVFITEKAIVNGEKVDIFIFLIKYSQLESNKFTDEEIATRK